MLLLEVTAFEYPEARAASSIPVLPGLSLLIEEALKRSQTEDDGAVSRWLLATISQPWAATPSLPSASQQQKRLPTQRILSAPLTLIFNPTPKSGSSPTQILAARLHQTMAGNWSTSWVDLDDKSQLACFGVNQPAQAYAIVAVLLHLDLVFSRLSFPDINSTTKSEHRGRNLSGSGIGLRASNLSCPTHAASGERSAPLGESQLRNQKQFQFHPHQSSLPNAALAGISPPKSTAIINSFLLRSNLMSDCYGKAGKTARR